MNILSAAILIGTIVLFNNCSKPNTSISDNQLGNSVQAVTVLKTEPITFLNLTYEARLLKVDGATGPIYVEYIPACSSPCPLVVISQPYVGIDWSGEAGDFKWANRPSSDIGYSFKDEDGPLYDSNSVGEIHYRKYSAAGTLGAGAFFLANKINVGIILHRFYRGNNLERYVQDHVKATLALAQQKEVDSSSIAFQGVSLGGFISAHSNISGSVKTKALVLVSPLLDLKDFWNHGLTSIPNKVNANPALLTSYLKFFDPYIRRILAFTGGTPVQAPGSFAKYSVESLAAEIKVPTLVLHDTWDTLVPFEQSQKLKNLSSKIQEVWFQHAGPIDWNSFGADHSQPSEGLNYDNVMPFHQLFLMKNLVTAQQPLTVYYEANKLSKAFSEMRQAQVRGQNIAWLRARFIEWCDARVSFVDYSNTLGTITGPQMVHGVLTNIWGKSIANDQACTWIANNPL